MLPKIKYPVYEVIRLIYPGRLPSPNRLPVFQDALPRRPTEIVKISSSSASTAPSMATVVGARSVAQTDAISFVRECIQVGKTNIEGNTEVITSTLWC